MDYTIIEHVHRLAAWGASRAAAASLSNRFSVERGKLILEAVGLQRLLAGPEALPEPDAMDDAHREWRNAVIAAAHARGLAFTHGVAAKLINVYLKIGLVNTAYHAHPNVAAVHPPIDRELLNGLIKADAPNAQQWRRFRDAAWSNYDSDTYENVIAAVRAFLGPTTPLWRIEEAWQGHQ
ncbi:hypothetical protein [Paraburkholderia sediminicola]|uniref:hypothetical protein n=1 Tax=Paraburkholderia sediminicola TaxID=458836 RepID=UPI0038BACF00